MSKRIYVGIDPGIAGGAIGILRGRKFDAAHDFPVVKVKSRSEVLTAALVNLFDELRQERPSSLVIGLERAQPYPKQGISSAFRYGEVYGQVKGMLIAMGLTYTLISPAKWKKTMMQGASEKEASIHYALQLFPSMAGTLKFKKDHNKAEAILLAEYVRRTNPGEPTNVRKRL